MTQEISSLMDGELEAHEAERAIRGCCADSEAARKWQEYHLISDVLRGGRPHPSGTAERVRKLLESEPAIVARPRRVLDTTFGRVARTGGRIGRRIVGGHRARTLVRSGSETS